jgi:hypothetical protein
VPAFESRRYEEVEVEEAEDRVVIDEEAEDEEEAEADGVLATRLVRLSTSMKRV